jgi:hypothetical protein
MTEFMRVVYNLSNIPEFIDALKENNSENFKKLNIINYITKLNETYKIIRYDKNLLCIDNIPDYGLLRSVVVNSQKHVVSFAPPKSIPSDKFIEMYPDAVFNENIIAQEFVEGTMINAFWDDSKWQIATRNTVGAEVSFFQNGKTFNTMFQEACKECNLDLNLLNKNFCYSFVLQHPENRIVVPFVKSILYLVEVYQIQNLPDNNIKIYQIPLNEIIHFGLWSNTGIYFPERYEFKSYSDLIEKYASSNTSYNILGVVIKNLKTGERCKIRNPSYEQVKHLKGNQPKMQYQYLVLRKEGKVAEFLKFYPENKKEFSKYRDQLHYFTNNLFKNYISCYIKKEKPLLVFPSQYRTHMFKIHEKYLNELKEKNLYVTNTVIINYVNSLHPSQQMFSINFHMRKRIVDFIKADEKE